MQHDPPGGVLQQVEFRTYFFSFCLSVSVQMQNAENPQMWKLYEKRGRKSNVKNTSGSWTL